jgi:hypothetical protein
MQLLAPKMQSSNVHTLCTQYCPLIEVFGLLNFDEFFLWIYRFLICKLFPPIYNSVNFQSIASQYSVNFLCRHDGTFNWIWTTSWADRVNLQWINNCSLFFLKIKLPFSMFSQMEFEMCHRNTGTQIIWQFSLSVFWVHICFLQLQFIS